MTGVPEATNPTPILLHYFDLSLLWQIGIHSIKTTLSFIVENNKLQYSNTSPNLIKTFEGHVENERCEFFMKNSF